MRLVASSRRARTPKSCSFFRPSFECLERRDAPAVGLVAAYGFNEGSGTTAGDSSGSGNVGAVNGATWSVAGRFGGALSFNGTSSSVTVNDSNSLDLTTGMTLEAWVNPSSLSNYRTVMMKEDGSWLSYLLYANDGYPRPAVYLHNTAHGDQSANGPSTL